MGAYIDDIGRGRSTCSGTHLLLCCWGREVLYGCNLGLPLTHSPSTCMPSWHFFSLTVKPASSRCFSTISRLLGTHRLLLEVHSPVCQHRSNPHGFDQEDQAQQGGVDAIAFRKLRELLSTAPAVLRSPDFGKEFIVQTDASDRGVGAVLSQADGKGRPACGIFQPQTAAQRRTILIRGEGMSGSETRSASLLCLVTGTPVYGGDRPSNSGMAGQTQGEQHATHSLELVPATLRLQGSGRRTGMQTASPVVSDFCAENRFAAGEGGRSVVDWASLTYEYLCVSFNS